MRPFYLPERIKESRQKMGLSGKGLAKLVGVSKSCISHYETGVRNPSQPIFDRLAQVLQTSTAYLLGITDNTQPDLIIIRDKKLAFLLNEILADTAPISDETMNRLRKYLEEFRGTRTQS